MKQRVIIDMSKPLNPPNEQVILVKDGHYIEFAWNPSERGVRVTEGLGDSKWHYDIEWDRLSTFDMTRPDARQHWIAYKRLGYRREESK